MDFLGSTTWFGLPILPVFVFLAEVTVVTIGTMRTIFIARGRKGLAPILGLFEVSIWLFAIGQVMQNLNDPRCFVAFASGFAAGNYFGILLEKKLAIGNLVVNVISHRDAGVLIESLTLAEYGVTAIGARGATGPVQVVSTVIKRKELNNVLAIVKQFDANAFYSVNEVQEAVAGIFTVGTRKGHTRGGRAFTKTSLYQLLTNVTYAGNVKYKHEVHTGEHEAIVDADV